MLIGRLGDAALAAAALAHTVLFAAFTVGMGLVVGRGAAGVAGLRRARSRAWCAARCASACGRRVHGGRAADGACSSGARRSCWRSARRRETQPLPAATCTGLGLEPDPGLGLHGAAQLHGRGEPARAGAVDHAGGDPHQRACWPTRLIYGAFGLPALDLLGAGLATTIVNVGMCAPRSGSRYTRRPFKKYRVLGRFWRPDWPLLGKLLRGRRCRSRARCCSSTACSRPRRC